jgi:hypothetical protein
MLETEPECFLELLPGGVLPGSVKEYDSMWRVSCICWLQARGRIYYVDKNTFPDAEVLEKLMPAHPAQHEMDLAMQQADMSAGRPREGLQDRHFEEDLDSWHSTAAGRAGTTAQQEGLAQQQEGQGQHGSQGEAKGQ